MSWMEREPVLLPFLYVEQVNRRFAGLVLLEDVGRRKLRFLFMYNGQLRAMAWLAVGSDGSLYLNPRLKPHRGLISGSAIADGIGGFTDTDLREVPVESLAEPNPKLSHHASGVVVRADGRSTSLSPRSVTENTLFRQDDYGHPSRFEVIPPPDLRTTDVIVPSVGGVPFELDEGRPLTSRIMVAPLREGEAQVQLIDDVEVDAQTTIVAPFRNLVGCQDLTYQVTFFNGRPGPWPDITTMAVLDLG